jgi:aminocarboxymuconate-semialdehyde decarboxylase
MCYDGMFEEFPDIRWIIGHLGGAVPYLMERMDNGFRDFADCRAKIDQLPSVYLKRLYYDTVSFSPHTLTMVRNMVGADHMVMGAIIRTCSDQVIALLVRLKAWKLVRKKRDRSSKGQL